MSEPFVQKNGDRLKVVDGRLYRLIPLKKKDDRCDGCAINGTTGCANVTEVKVSNRTTGWRFACCVMRAVWKDITSTLPEEIRRKYGRK